MSKEWGALQEPKSHATDPQPQSEVSHGQRQTQCAQRNKQCIKMHPAQEQTQSLTATIDEAAKTPSEKKHAQQIQDLREKELQLRRKLAVDVRLHTIKQRLAERVQMLQQSVEDREEDVSFEFLNIVNRDEEQWTRDTVRVLFDDLTYNALHKTSKIRKILRDETGKPICRVDTFVDVKFLHPSTQEDVPLSTRPKRVEIAITANEIRADARFVNTNEIFLPGDLHETQLTDPVQTSTQPRVINDQTMRHSDTIVHEGKRSCGTSTHEIPLREILNKYDEWCREPITEIIQKTLPEMQRSPCVDLCP